MMAIFQKSFPLLVAAALLGPGACSSSSSSNGGGGDNGGGGAIVSQTSTGAFTPYTPRSQSDATVAYTPDSDAVIAVFTSRATFYAGTVAQKAKLTMELKPAGIDQTAKLQIVSPLIVFHAQDSAGNLLSRSALAKDIKVETLVNRYIEQKHTVVLMLLNYGIPAQGRAMILPADLSFEVQPDNSRRVTFSTRDTDFAFAVAATSDGQPSDGYGAFAAIPHDSSAMLASTGGVTDTATQVKLAWTPATGSRTGYKLQTAAAPITSLGCDGGVALDNAAVTSLHTSFPVQTDTDSYTVKDLTPGQLAYIQLCSTNSRVPPDVSPGLNFSYQVPQRATASLSGTPTDPTNAMALNITVSGAGLTSYQYALLAAKETCTGATYGAWTDVATPITDKLNEGAKLLCVLGKKSDSNVQLVATTLAWTVDHTPPGAFHLAAVTSPTKNTAPTVSWSAASGVSVYTAIVAGDSACNVALQSFTTSALTVTPATLTEGTYYICVTATDAAGNSTVAGGSGAVLNVDTTPPSAFTITAPTNGSTVYSSAQAVTWSDPGNADFYDVKIDHNSDCASPEQSYSNLTTPTQLSTPLADGTWYVCVRARDNAGNFTDSTNSGLNFTVATNVWSAVTASGAPAARLGATSVWDSVHKRMVVWGGFDGTNYLDTGGAYDPALNAWSATNVTDVDLPAGRTRHTATWTGTQMLIWGGHHHTADVLGDGAAYNPAGPDYWVPFTKAGAPAARKDHSSVWSGTRLIVWGGSDGTSVVNTGGMYDLGGDSWTATDLLDPALPVARAQHTAVWTGTKMIVWGGMGSGGAALADGAVFSPSGVPSYWTTMSPVNAPSARYGHTATWTGSKLVIFGGFDGTNYLNGGAIYDPRTDTWVQMSGASAPTARELQLSVWSGTRLLVWGGYDGTNYLRSGAAFDPVSNVWTAPALNLTGSPTGRTDGTAVWDGLQMTVFGGFDGTSVLGAGAQYHP